MGREIIATDKVARPGGAYSHAVKAGNLLFIAGQVAIGPEGRIVGRDDVVAQTEQIMENMKALLEAAGTTLDNVVKLTLFVTNMENRGKIDEVRRRYLKEPFPASTLVQVVCLAHPAFLLEIEAVAKL
ncbi:MAG: RidA family protein [Chloroflexi bacterium]|nr:RidA family protein [Chloroflexota bacterium]